MRLDVEHPETGPAERDFYRPRFRVKCFLRADRWFNRLVNLERALHKGFWLGCLSPDDFNVITAEAYKTSQHLASAEHIQSGLLDWESCLVGRHFPKGSRILVAAAGAGREVLALRKAGFSAEGFECNLRLLSAAQKAFEEARESSFVAFCPPDTVPPGPQIYDGLLVGWGGYTHIPARVRRIAFLRALRLRALPQAPIMLSFFTRDGYSRYDAISYHTAKVFRILSRAGGEALEPGDDLDWSQYVHRFLPSEVEQELKTAGFRIVHYKEGGGAGQAVAIAE